MRAIVLFNPDARGLDANVSSLVETFREMVYATLEEHCRINHPDEQRCKSESLISSKNTNFIAFLAADLQSFCCDSLLLDRLV